MARGRDRKKHSKTSRHPERHTHRKKQTASQRDRQTDRARPRLGLGEAGGRVWAHLQFGGTARGLWCSAVQGRLRDKGGGEGGGPRVPDLGVYLEQAPQTGAQPGPWQERAGWAGPQLWHQWARHAHLWPGW